MVIKNKCGECTLCCTLFPVKWLNKPPLTDCKHCILKKGCGIQDTKDDECRDFDCMYVQVGNIPIDLRPDKCGIIFEKWSDKIIYGTLDPNNEPSDMAKGQIQNFVQQGFSVVLASIKETTNKFFISKNHKEQDIRDEFYKLINTYGNLRN
jgi:hypothetical protein